MSLNNNFLLCPICKKGKVKLHSFKHALSAHDRDKPSQLDIEYTCNSLISFDLGCYGFYVSELGNYYGKDNECPRGKYCPNCFKQFSYNDWYDTYSPMCKCREPSKYYKIEVPGLTIV